MTQAPITDHELLARVGATADRSAFVQLYDRHAPAVWALCLPLAGQHQPATQQAETLLTEVFTRLWQQAFTITNDCRTALLSDAVRLTRGNVPPPTAINRSAGRG